MTTLHRRAMRYLGLALCAWVLPALSACGGGGDIPDERIPSGPRMCIDNPEVCK